MKAKRQFAPIWLLAILLALTIHPLGCQSGDDDDIGDDDDSPTGDNDGDGWEAPVDCDDDRAESYPGATELCDGLDNDCDGAPAGFEQDGDGDGEMDCLALLWGVHALTYSHYIELVDALIEIIEGRSSDSCPTQSHGTSAILATAIDGVEVSTEQEDMTITGNCSSSSTDFTGSLLLSSYQDNYDPVESTWDGELRGLTLTTQSFAANSAGAVSETLLLAGSVSGTEDIRVDNQGKDSASEWGGINLALELEVTGLSTGIPEFLRERSTELQIQQTHRLDTCHTEQGCDFEEETFSTAGSASRNTSTGSWMAQTTTLNWLYRFKTPEPGDPKQETGCYFEPGNGEIQVTAPGANGSAEPWTASIIFDGDQACDGCGQVTIGETSVGLWCGLAPLEAGS